MGSFKAVSLFSGCGGFCEGVRLSGFDVLAAVEWDRFAAETYRHNFPEVPLFEGDIHDFLDPTAETWAAEADRFKHLEDLNDLDLVFGGPPCQGYSQIGTRLLDDPRNELYAQFVRVLDALKPKVFLMENVPNMLLLGKGRFKEEALTAFAEHGYSNVGVTVTAATDYGVPQLRRRAFFFGVRDDLDLECSALGFFESALEGERQSEQTVRQAIGDLPEETAIHYEPLAYPTGRPTSPIAREMRLDANGRWYSAAYKKRLAGGATLHNHHTKEIRERRQNLIAMLEPGAKADSLPKSVWNGARPEKWRRLHPDKPAYTILAQMHRDLSEWVHPDFERWITVREAARLQSFHDGFVFKSSEWQMLKQIGNAVPPLLGRAVAAAAEQALLALDANTIDLASMARQVALSEPT